MLKINIRSYPNSYCSHPPIFILTWIHLLSILSVHNYVILKLVLQVLNHFTAQSIDIIIDTSQLTWRIIYHMMCCSCVLTVTGCHANMIITTRSILPLTIMLQSVVLTDYHVIHGYSKSKIMLGKEHLF